MKITHLGVTVLALLYPLSMVAYAASSVPVLDVKTTCGEAESVTGEAPRAAAKRGAPPPDRRTFNACMADEKQAHDELATKWSSFKRSDQVSCVQAGAAPNPSYVELLTCLEMSTPTFSGRPQPDAGAGARPDAPKR